MGYSLSDSIRLLQGQVNQLLFTAKTTMRSAPFNRAFWVGLVLMGVLFHLGSCHPEYLRQAPADEQKSVPTSKRKLLFQTFFKILFGEGPYSEDEELGSGYQSKSAAALSSSLSADKTGDQPNKSAEKASAKRKAPPSTATVSNARGIAKKRSRPSATQPPSVVIQFDGGALRFALAFSALSFG